MPDLAENFMALAASLLKEKHHGILISAIQLCVELCKASKDALEYLRKVRAFISCPQHLTSGKRTEKNQPKACHSLTVPYDGLNACPILYWTQRINALTLCIDDVQFYNI